MSMSNDKKKPLDAFLVLARMSFGGRRRRSPAEKVAAVLIVVLPLALLVYLLWPVPEQPPLLLTAFDEVALPGETISVRARVESLGVGETSAGWPRCDLYFHELQSDWREKVATDRSGCATVQRSFSGAPGTVDITVRYLGEEQRRHQAQAMARLFTWPPESPLLIVDVESTIPGDAATAFWTVDNRDIHPRPEVAASLRAAQAKYRIGYVSAEADRPSYYNKVRAWLERGWAPAVERFPGGPVLARGSRLPLREPADFLQATLKDLKQRFHGTLVGVTPVEANARIFNEAGWRTFLLGETREPPAGITLIKSWSDLSGVLP